MRMPPFGSSAVPFPMKIRRKSATGFDVNDAVADAFGENTCVPAAGPISGSAGSPDVVVADAAGLIGVDPSSRRATANADHNNGSATGAPPGPPDSSHRNRPRPIPLTDPPADAGRTAAVITGASTTESATTGTTTTGTAAAAGTAPPTGTSGTDTSGTSSAEAADGADGADGADDRGITGLTGTLAGTSSARPALSERSQSEPDSETPTRTASASKSRPPPTADGESAPPAAAEFRPERSEGSPSEVSDSAPTRPPARVLARASDRAAEPEAPDAEEPDPVDPPDPVISANATGIDATAEPTPNATAKAPTRPTNRANPAAEAGSAAMAPKSIRCTRRSSIRSGFLAITWRILFTAESRRDSTNETIFGATPTESLTAAQP